MEYTTLAKFLSGEASKEEAALVQQYKKTDPEEYDRLEALWGQKSIKLNQFDSTEAWQKVERGASGAKPQSGRTSKLIALVTALLLVLGALYFMVLKEDSKEIVKVRAMAQGQQVELNDGSIVTMNQGATLSYPKSFRSDLRELHLEGEAFFEVERDESRPFVVHTTHSTVEVLGTSFNIDAEEAETKVEVATGKVRVAHETSQETAILTKNESVTLTPSKLSVDKSADPNFMAWKTGVFRFANASPSQVIADLQTYYGKKISLKNPNASCSFTSTFDNRSLKEIAEIIQLSCDLKLTEKNGSYELY